MHNLVTMSMQQVQNWSFINQVVSYVSRVFSYYKRNYPYYENFMNVGL